MALQTSGSISLNDIFVEGNSPYASGQQSDMNQHSVRYLVEATGRDISKGTSTPISFSDFYGATKFEWSGGDDSSAPSFDTADTNAFTMTDDDTTGGQAYAGTNIRLGVSGGSLTTITATYYDDTTGPTLSTPSSAGSDTFSMSINPYWDPGANAARNTDHGLEWRWAVSGLDVDFTNGHSQEAVYFGYYNVAQFVSQQSYVGTGGNINSGSFTTAWRTWNPIANIALNIKMYCKANETTGGLSQTVVRLNTGGYMRIEFRQKDDGTTADHHYVRKNYVSGSNPRFQASSFEEVDEGS